MKYSIRWSIVATCMVFLSHVITVRPVFADILSGTYMLPPAGDSKLIPFMNGQFDPNAITMGLCFPEDLLVDVTPYFTTNPLVGIGLNDGMMTPQFKINCLAMGEA